MEDSAFGVATTSYGGHPFLPILVMLVIVQVTALGMWLLATVLGPKRPSPQKSKPFEFGNEPGTVRGRRFAIKYYVVALFFLIFDLETAFLYPFAVLLREVGWAGLGSLAAFLALLLVALVYVWRKGALTWER